MKSKLSRVFISALSAILIGLLFVFLLEVFATEEGLLRRILILLGGDMPFGIIQILTYFLFVFGMLELRNIQKFVRDESSAYECKLLPEEEQFVLYAKDVNQIKLDTITWEKEKSRFLLTELVKKACTKYRANKSTSEAMEIVVNQNKLNLSNSESDQGLVRYTAWAIPSIGFVGTIIGIANSLGLAHKAGSAEGLQQITVALNVAFDTTLVAIMLSIFLMLYYHIIQSKVERFHSNMEEYVVDNLINRIYKS